MRMIRARKDLRSAVARIVRAASLAGLTGFAAISAGGAAGADGEWASIVRGGRLYDTWYEEIRGRPPFERHPSYPADGQQAADPPTTWRCKECHGWDYRGRNGVYGSGPHYTGIAGIDGRAGAEPRKIAAILKDDTHGYGNLMAEADLTDLALFVSRGQVDMDRYIDRASGRVKGDASARVTVYQTICANCHGRDGLKVRDMPPLGRAVRDDPWQALHNILNGHPNEKMPSLRVLGMDTIVDVLAYAQALPEEEVLASIARGGRLYDNWPVTIGVAAPNARHPAYPAGAAFAKEPAVNWRCKECHGWDYRGRDGAYARGPHATGIKGIRDFAGADPTRVVAVLKDANHRYGGRLDLHDLQDVANFVSRGQVDMNTFIDPVSALARGDAARRTEYYATICANCHGADGAKIVTSPPLGRTARTNPWEALHKVLNGHPDEKMPAMRVIDRQIVADILAYIQNLPDIR